MAGGADNLIAKLRRRWKPVLIYGTIAIAAAMAMYLKEQALDARLAMCASTDNLPAVIRACTQLLSDGDLDEEGEPKALIFRGRAFWWSGVKHEAVADFNRAAYLNPNYAEAHYWLGIVDHANGDTAEALARFNQAIRLDPDYAEAYVGRAGVQVARGLFGAALPDYDQAIALGDRGRDVFNNRCFVRAMLGAARDALDDCARALADDPDFTHALDSRAVAFFRLGELDRGLADANRAIELSPEPNWEMHAHRAAIHYGLGLRDKAARDMALARELAGARRDADNRIKLLGLDPDRLAAGR